MRMASAVVLGAAWVGVLGGCNGPAGPEGRKLLLEANSAYRRGDDASAVRACSKFLQLHPRAEEAGEAHYVRGLARLRQDDVAAARSDLAEAVRIAKRRDLVALAHAKLGELAYNAGNLALAEAHYRAVLPSTPAGASPADEAMYRLGCILQHRGGWREADQFFLKVIHFFDDTELAKRSAARVHAARWSIQVGAYAAAAVAEDARRQLARAGLAARVDREVREGRMLRLVRVGSYPTYARAQADLPKVKALRRDAFVTPAR